MIFLRAQVILFLAGKVILIWDECIHWLVAVRPALLASECCWSSCLQQNFSLWRTWVPQVLFFGSTVPLDRGRDNQDNTLFPNSCSFIHCERTLTCLLLNPPRPQGEHYCIDWKNWRRNCKAWASLVFYAFLWVSVFPMETMQSAFLPQIRLGKLKADIGQVEHLNYGEMESFR